MTIYVKAQPRENKKKTKKQNPSHLLSLQHADRNLATVSSSSPPSLYTPSPPFSYFCPSLCRPHRHDSYQLPCHVSSLISPSHCTVAAITIVWRRKQLVSWGLLFYSHLDFGCNIPLIVTYKCKYSNRNAKVGGLTC